MPNYANTIIYKLQHQEDNSLIYVGSTTDFTNRKRQHKKSCHNPNNKCYNFKLYQMIRDNGGWDCFKMVQIKEYPCENKRQAEAEEDAIMLNLKANMNFQRASRSDKQYREDNKKKMGNYRNQYYEKNREQILQKQKQKVACECGCIVTKRGLSAHKKTKKHIELLNETLTQ